MSLLYRIRVKNHLGTYWKQWFEKMTVINLENGLTELVGPVKDQDALHCILEKIRDLNLTLVSVESEGEKQYIREVAFDKKEGMVYEIKVKASGEPWWAGWFEEVDILSLENDEFLLIVILKDHPALHGLLDRIRAAHLTLLSLNRVPTPHNSV